MPRNVGVAGATIPIHRATGSRPAHPVAEDQSGQPAVSAACWNTPGTKSIWRATERALATQRNVPGLPSSIIDMHMPQLSRSRSGAALAFHESGHLPHIMLNRRARAEAAGHVRSRPGADAFLTKPVNSREMLE